jgi:hypothetical protein
MTTFTVRSATSDPTLEVFSAGEAVRAATTSSSKAAVAGYQNDPTPNGTGAALFGENNGYGPGVVAHQNKQDSKAPALIAECEGVEHCIKAIQKNPNSAGAALYAQHAVGKVAGFFQGDVVVTGDLSFPGADCAEEFRVSEEAIAEPGTLMALNPTGELVPSDSSYDRKVVGVVAGAGSMRSGIILGRGEEPDPQRRPIALVGTVYCKVDAREQPIEVGDLLTSSRTPGHAMKADDPSRSFGAIIGKAMAPLAGGLGLIPILISLQ